MGCDLKKQGYDLDRIYFNPRTHVGCDVNAAPLTDIEILISIHAPTWGATIAIRRGLEMLYISIHAPTWGATAATAQKWRDGVFQSTHPRGVRL